jgi:hypothetical protein
MVKNKTFWTHGYVTSAGACYFGLSFAVRQPHVTVTGVDQVDSFLPSTAVCKRRADTILARRSSNLRMTWLSYPDTWSRRYSLVYRRLISADLNTGHRVVGLPWIPQQYNPFVSFWLVKNLAKLVRFPTLRVRWQGEGTSFVSTPIPLSLYNWIARSLPAWKFHGPKSNSLLNAVRHVQKHETLKFFGEPLQWVDTSHRLWMKQIIQNTYIYTVISTEACVCFFYFHDATVLSGPGPFHYQGFTITLI